MDEADFEALLAQGERKRLDCKRAMKFDGDERFELVKDALGMANTVDGGDLVIGVSEDAATKELQPNPMTDEQLKSFDITTFLKFVNTYASPPLTAYRFVVSWKGGRALVLRIAEFTTTPVICRQLANNSKNKRVLAEGAIYVRTDSASTEAISDHATMLDLLNQALRKRSDQLLADIAHVMRGSTQASAAPTNDWDVEQEVSGAPIEPIDQFNGLGSVRYTAHPTTREGVRLSHKQLRDIVQRTSVEFRGWDFPHIDNHGSGIKNRRESESGLDYVEQMTVWAQIAESWHLFSTGFFQLKRVLIEDLQSRAGHRFTIKVEPKTVLNWQQAIGEAGEFILFVGRLFEQLGFDGNVALKVDYNGLAGRRLFAYDSGRDFLFRVTPRTSAEDRFVFRRTVSIAEVRADPISVVVPLLTQFFSLFGWEIEEGMIRNDLTALYNRRA